MLTFLTQLTRPQARWLAAAWIALIYLATALWTLFVPTPPGIWQLEVRQISLHLLGYGLTALALTPLLREEEGRLPLPRLLIACLLTGIGQELLQAGIRHQLMIGGSLLDLAVDLAGASSGWLLLRRRLRFSG